MLKLNGEESNYYVLEEVLKELKAGEWAGIIDTLEEFLEPKREIVSETLELTIASRRGDNNASIELIRKLAELNDGL